MQKKILVNAPVLSASGYGEMARFALKALREQQEHFDIYVNVLNWGQTGYLFEENEEFNWITHLRVKTEQYVSKGGQFDLSLQITIPNEWKKMAAVNIGYTAGIETNYISPAWLEPSQQMDKIIVISEHAKSGFLNTIFGDNQGQQFKVTTPVEVVHFPYLEKQEDESTLELTSDFNFLTVNQWGPRKNIEQLIAAFVEEFREEDVGLVIKTNMANDSTGDRFSTEQRLRAILASLGTKKCKVTFVHGRLTDRQMNSLYRNPKIKAFVSSTHGEGFGFPIFEATQAELPVIATDWSGHLDFLRDESDKKLFAKVDFELKPIAQEHVWQGVMEQGVSWAYPSNTSLKSRMSEVYKDHGRFSSWAKKLATYNVKKFDKQKVHDDFFYSLGIFSRPKTLEPKPITGISFCIPTHGKRLDKTRLTINSIKKQKWDGIPYEIIVCGDVDSFKDDSSLKLVDQKEAAHSKKVAKLRNSAAALASYETIAFCDDDIILAEDWLENTVLYSQTNGWEVLGNKVFSPDGTRYWDRSLLNPHILTNYNHPNNDKMLYQSSAFFMIRDSVLNDVKWDETKLVFADKEGGIPEDVQFSNDLLNKGYELNFNKNALVWHNDDSYTEFSVGNASIVQTKEYLSKMHNFNFFLPHDDEYRNLIGNL